MMEIILSAVGIGVGVYGAYWGVQRYKLQKKDIIEGIQEKQPEIEFYDYYPKRNKFYFRLGNHGTKRAQDLGLLLLIKPSPEIVGPLHWEGTEFEPGIECFPTPLSNDNRQYGETPQNFIQGGDEGEFEVTPSIQIVNNGEFDPEDQCVSASNAIQSLIDSDANSAVIQPVLTLENYKSESVDPIRLPTWVANLNRMRAFYSLLSDIQSDPNQSDIDDIFEGLSTSDDILTTEGLLRVSDELKPMGNPRPRPSTDHLFYDITPVELERRRSQK